MRIQLKSGLAAALCACALSLFASPSRAADLPVIQFDPETKAFSSLLPYRTPFTLDIPAPKNAKSVAVTFWETKPGVVLCNATDPSALHLSGKALPTTPDATEKHFQLTLPALHAGAGYCISVETVMPWSAEENARVVAIVTEEVVNLQVTGHMTQATLAQKISDALGTHGTAKVENRSGTVNAEIQKVLWGGGGASRSRALVRLEKATTGYGNARTHLLRYLKVLETFEQQSKGAGGALEAAVIAAISQLDAAKLDFAGVPAAPATLAAIKSAMAAVGGKATTLEQQDCAKTKDPKAKHDCEIGKSVLVSDPMFAAGADYLDALITAADEFASAKNDLASDLNLVVKTFIVSSGSISVTASSASYTEVAPLYISGDVGVSVPLLVNRRNSYGADVQLYVAVSIALIPIDKDVPLSKEDGFLRRFSLVGGFTLAQIKSSDGSVTGVFDGVGVLGGAGFRITDYVRFGGGAVLLRQNDTNKLISDTHVRVAPYLSLSIDLDVAGVVTGIFSKGAGLHI